MLKFHLLERVGEDMSQFRPLECPRNSRCELFHTRNKNAYRAMFKRHSCGMEDTVHVLKKTESDRRLVKYVIIQYGCSFGVQNGDLLREIGFYIVEEGLSLKLQSSQEVLSANREEGSE